MSEARLQREARETCLGRIGSGENTARVEVSWWWEVDDGMLQSHVEEHAGFYLVSADADDDADGIYATFERLVTEHMENRQRRLGFHDWQIDDTYAA